MTEQTKQRAWNNLVDLWSILWMIIFFAGIFWWLDGGSWNWLY